MKLGILGCSGGSHLRSTSMLSANQVIPDFEIQLDSVNDSLMFTGDIASYDPFVDCIN